MNYEHIRLRVDLYDLIDKEPAKAKAIHEMVVAELIRLGTPEKTVEERSQLMPL